MKQKKRICICICIVMLCRVAGCSENKNEVGSENQESTEVNQTLDAKIEIATRGCEVAEEGEEIQQDSITYKVNSVSVTKQTGEWSNMSGPDPKVNEKGEIIEDASYVVVNVTVKDEGDFDFWWNNFWLVSFNDNDFDIGPSELVSVGIYNDYSEEERADRDIYQYKLPQGEEVTTDLIFVLEDAEMTADEHFLLEFNPTGANLVYVDAEDYSMVYLKSMEEVCNGNVAEK